MNEQHEWVIDGPGLVSIIRGQNFPLHKALLELVDNGIDAGATDVAIREIDDGTLRISDNGKGFTDLQMAFAIGMSDKFDGMIGRYGYGLKAAAVKYSSKTRIHTGSQCAVVDWDAPKIKIDVAQAIATKGSVIEFIGFRSLCKQSGVPTHEIRRAYAVAIDSGLTIRYNGEPLDSMPLPSFVQEVRHEFEFEGKHVVLRGGLFKSDDPQRRYWNGYNVFYKGRLIGDGRETKIGTGDSDCTSFSFILEIADGDNGNKWSLSTHKDALENYEELLTFTYHTYTKPVLDAAASVVEELELQDQDKEIDQAINGHLTGPITRTPPASHPGPAKETGEGAKKQRTRTSNGRPGAYQADSGVIGGPRNRRLLWKREPLDGNQLCEVQDRKKSQIVILNTNNPFVEMVRKERNTHAQIGMIIMAFAMYRKGCMETFNEATFKQQILNPVFDFAGDELAIVAGNIVGNDQ